MILTVWDRPAWFSAIASGDIMRVKTMVSKKELNFSERFKEDMMASFSFGDASKGANVFTPRKRRCGIFDRVFFRFSDVFFFLFFFQKTKSDLRRSMISLTSLS